MQPTSSPPTQSPISPKMSMSFRISPSAPMYFHHRVDADTGTLTVEVLGPNLTLRLHHARAPGMTRSDLAARLARKTVGFLALASNGADRHVLAWAESGHGAGLGGDVLAAKGWGPVLPNAVWTRRVVRIAGLLGIELARPFDMIRTKRAERSEAACDHEHDCDGDDEHEHGQHGHGQGSEELRGIFQGSHVEAKLAVYAICLMLHTFGVTSDSDGVTLDHLRALRTARWADGTRPAFDVFFSRRNCGPCGRLAARLAEMTGIPVVLSWRHRLEKKVYTQINVKGNPRPAVATPTQQEQQQPQQEAVPEAVSELVEAAPETEDIKPDISTPLVTLPADPIIIDLTDEPPKRRPGRIATATAAGPPSSISKPLPATPVTEHPTMAAPQKTKPSKTSRPARARRTVLSSPEIDADDSVDLTTDEPDVRVVHYYPLPTGSQPARQVPEQSDPVSIDISSDEDEAMADVPREFEIWG